MMFYNIISFSLEEIADDCSYNNNNVIPYIFNFNVRMQRFKHRAHMRKYMKFENATKKFLKLKLTHVQKINHATIKNSIRDNINIFHEIKYRYGIYKIEDW